LLLEAEILSVSSKMLGHKEEEKNINCGFFSIASLLVMKLCWPIRKTVPPIPFNGAFTFTCLLPPSHCHSTLAPHIRVKWLCNNAAFPQTFSFSLSDRTRRGTSCHPTCSMLGVPQLHNCQENSLPWELRHHVATKISVAVFSQAA